MVQTGKHGEWINMKIAFITESSYTGKYPRNFNNARTEIAWQIALDADHFNFFEIKNVSDYDHVFVIIPKGRVFLSAEGIKALDGVNPIKNLLKLNVAQFLKTNNSKVHFIQEGPTWWPLDYTVEEQIDWYNTLVSFDSIFCHNEHDKKYYKGLLPTFKVNVIKSLMIEDTISSVTPIREDKTIIGGNFSHFYGGFNSYFISEEFIGCEKYTMESHSQRDDEHLIDDLKHIPRCNWTQWINVLSTFKYAIHLMPTIAAGTFSLNCAYLGIPCIGNIKVDTQNTLFPELSVDVEDLESARTLAKKLNVDTNFYNYCSSYAKEKYSSEYHLSVWKHNMEKILSNI